MKEDILKTRMSRIRTMKPIKPPPLPYFQALPWVVALSVSSAITKEKKESCRSMPMMVWAIIAGLVIVMTGLEERG
jgi:hypothetical protein